MANKNLVIKSGELVVAPKRAEIALRSILHTLPHNKGWVFGLVSLEHKDETARERVVHIISSHVEHLAVDLGQDINPARRFEQMLARVNRDLTKAAEELGLRREKFEAILGIVIADQIFLSGAGTLQALFLHKTAERRFVVYELSKQFAEREDRGWDKPLLTVLDGELNQGDVLYIATALSHQAVSINDLQDILVTLPPAGALERISHYIPTTEAYAAIAFHAMEDGKAGPPKKGNPLVSLQDLEDTKERTATVLGEEQQDLATTVRELANGMGKHLSAPGTRSLGTTFKRVLKLVFTGLAGVVAGGVSLASKGWRALASRMKAPAGGGRTKTRALGRAKASGQKTGSFVLGLLGNRKFTGIVILFLIVIVTGSFFLSRGNAEKNREAESYAAILDQIEEDILAAEASLIYNNTSEAGRSFDQAAAALETLPRDTPEAQSEADRLGQELAKLQARIRGITLIEPSVLADLATSDSSVQLLEATATATGIYGIGDNLGLYRLNSPEKTWVREANQNGSITRVTSVTRADPGFLFVDSTQQLGRADLTSLTLNPITSGTNGMAGVDDILLYNDSLYALTAKGQQIVKMRPQIPNFEGGTAWIAARTTDLTTARGIAIDGDVYVLTATDIVKFTQGREAAWPHATFDPPLAAPLDIWTAVESPFIYILDPQEKRIVVLKKDDGSRVAQYVAEAFSQAISFTIEESNNRILVITSTQALEFTPDHLIK